MIPTLTQPPVIGITTYAKNETGEITLPAAYLEAVERAGGVAVLLAPGAVEQAIAPLLQRLDGVILAGGGDIDPALYGGAGHATIYSVDPARDAFELAIARQVLAQGLPVLGICRGMQMLAVASGAALVPHLPEVYGNAIAHRLENPRRPTSHPVAIAPDSRLATWMGTTTATVASWHHQALETVPEGWQAIAQAADGVIEAMEHTTLPWAIAVQWHPELSATDPAHQGIFNAFIKACG